MILLARRRIMDAHRLSAPSLRSYGTQNDLTVGPRVGRFSRPGIRHVVSTLNPRLIQPGDHLDLSHRLEITLAFPHKQNTTTRSRLVYATTFNDLSKQREVPFPDNSKGFMYFHTQLNAAPLERSIRFRLTSKNDPASFSCGQDLTLPSGAPWQVVLPQLINARYHRLRDQLLHEDLVTKEQLSQCRRLFMNRRGASSISRLRPSLTMFRLSQEFPVNFDRSVCLFVVGKMVHRLYLGSIFSGDRFNPWTGSALARFEPCARHDWRRVVHMRIVKIVAPIAKSADQDVVRIVRPEEGNFLSVAMRGGAPKPWAYDIDRKTKIGAALRDLWDASLVKR
ncbi:hypothetical protein DFH06DRAFT_571342 [Mycena polygramma]|nr:hypothetical protein DFH06DRAFT_571342 [Mycena polygramma]